MSDLSKDQDILLFANAPDDIYEIAKHTNPTMAKVIEWCRAIVAAKGSESITPTFRKGLVP